MGKHPDAAGMLEFRLRIVGVPGCVAIATKVVLATERV